MHIRHILVVDGRSFLLPTRFICISGSVSITDDHTTTTHIAPYELVFEPHTTIETVEVRGRGMLGYCWQDDIGVSMGKETSLSQADEFITEVLHRPEIRAWIERYSPFTSSSSCQ